MQINIMGRAYGRRSWGDIPHFWKRGKFPPNIYVKKSYYIIRTIYHEKTFYFQNGVFLFSNCTIVNSGLLFEFRFRFHSIENRLSLIYYNILSHMISISSINVLQCNNLMPITDAYNCLCKITQI